MNLTTPLECWRDVVRFKAAVADAETVRKSLEHVTLKFDTLCSDTSPRCDDKSVWISHRHIIEPVQFASACIRKGIQSSGSGTHRIAMCEPAPFGDPPVRPYLLTKSVRLEGKHIFDSCATVTQETSELSKFGSMQ